MIEMTNEIHVFRMQKEGMKKEIMFRRQREDQMQSNLKRI